MLSLSVSDVDFEVVRLFGNKYDFGAARRGEKD